MAKKRAHRVPTFDSTLASAYEAFAWALRQGAAVHAKNSRELSRRARNVERELARLSDEKSKRRKRRKRAKNDRRKVTKK